MTRIDEPKTLPGAHGGKQVSTRRGRASNETLRPAKRGEGARVLSVTSFRLIWGHRSYKELSQFDDCPQVGERAPHPAGERVYRPPRRAKGASCGRPIWRSIVVRSRCP